MISKDPLIIDEIKKHIKQYPDFPREGILFGDIMPLFANPNLFQKTIDLCKFSAQQLPHFDTLVGIESRGFLIATPLALNMGKSFVPARKKGKLPGVTVKQTYDLEYGTDTVEMQKESIQPNRNYVIVDDILATGGTALATAKLIRNHGGNVVGFLFLIDLNFLNGVQLLKNDFPNTAVDSLITF